MQQSDAFSEAFQAFYPRIFSFILARTRDQHVAEDLTAEAFVRAYRYWDRLRHEEALASWLFRIAKNLVASHRRRTRTLERALDKAARFNTNGNDILLDPEEVVLHKEELAQLKHLLTRLSPREQEILALRFEWGLDSRQIGELLGLSDVHVRVIIYRALGRLRRGFEGAKTAADQAASVG
ncbi:MAG: sigma-70 family RNA polymerase sigma factor [Dehalococcoidia bacterium]|jgi:RNA polymerase sigma-70 factor (ECF subfamily)|nr:sigma-70 family RNA polymerase sigma factor [Dehalococcoidia bacterium]MDW8008867.1 sigma-70 family RNA polymerase sigma factor [Chloroflexota bacterium]